MTRNLGNLPKCYGCKFLCFSESGYSEYTITSSWIECLKMKFADRQRIQEWDDKIVEQDGFLAAAAAQCKDYSEGDPLDLSIGDGIFSDMKAQRLGES